MRRAVLLLALFAACGGGDASFDVFVGPTTLSLAAGGSGEVTVMVAARDGWEDALTITASGLPAGVTSPGLMLPKGTRTGKLVFNVAATATPSGPHSVTVSGSAGGVTRTAALSLSLLGMPRFEISASTDHLTLYAESRGFVDVTLTPMAGFNHPVELAVEGAPGSLSGEVETISNNTLRVTLIAAAAITPGDVNLTLRASGQGVVRTQPFTVTLKAPPAMDGAFETFPASDFGGDRLTVRVPSLGAGERVAIIPALSVDEAIGAFEVGVAGAAAVTTASPTAKAARPETDPPDLARQAHFARLVRDTERLRALGPSVPPPAARKARPADPPTRVFRVAVNLFGIDQPVDVQTTLEATTEHALVYVDDQLTPMEAAEAVGARFDEIYAIDRASWGEEADTDGNGRVILVVAKPLDNLGAFVTPLDYVDGMGNDGDIIYLCNQCLTRDFLAHEFKHVISQNQMFLARGIFEEPWLEEGLAVVAEDLADAHDKLLSRRFLSRPWLSPQFNRGGSGGGDYGPFYLLALYAGEQAGGSGSGAWARFLSNGRTGLANVELMTGRPFTPLFHDYATALLFDGTGILPEATHNYATIDLTAGDFRPMNYEIVGSERRTGDISNLRFFVSPRGTGGDATVTFRARGALPGLTLVRFDGDLPFPPRGAISGTVTAVAGGDVGNVAVCAVLPGTEECERGVLVDNRTASGTYTIEAIVPGAYDVMAGKLSEENGTVLAEGRRTGVTVTPQATTTGIDVQLIAK